MNSTRLCVWLGSKPLKILHSLNDPHTSHDPSSNTELWQSDRPRLYENYRSWRHFRWRPRHADGFRHQDPRPRRTDRRSESQRNRLGASRGAAKVEVDGSTHELQRDSIFDDPPTAIHLGPGAQIVIEPMSDEVEWAITARTIPRTSSR